MNRIEIDEMRKTMIEERKEVKDDNKTASSFPCLTEPKSEPVGHTEGKGKFYISDSGERYVNDNGGMRDIDDNKPDFTLIPHEALFRLAMHYKNGMNKYGKDNWKKLNTDKDNERFKASALRHLLQYLRGDVDEDHASASIFNIMALIYFDERKDK